MKTMQLNALITKRHDATKKNLVID